MSRQDSRQIGDVKVMLVKGDNGSSIESIEKTGSSGAVDTYTITLTDGSKQTFTVTNGKGITSIAKTGTSGLVDTYTITFNDGTTSTFTVTNGKGISNIAKTSTSGNVDTYTITYNDGTTSTFTVTNANTESLEAEIADIVNVYGAKNLIPYPYLDGMSKTNHGITYNVNSDGSVNVSGTKDSNATSQYYFQQTLNLPKGTYRMSGCPSGGSSNKYRLRLITNWQKDNAHIYVDNGGGTTFTIDYDVIPSATRIMIDYYGDTGTSYGDLVFHPMLRLASIKDDTYQHYAKTNKELTDDINLAKSDISNLALHLVTIANTNLNDYKTTGIYQFSGNYTPTNIPSGSNGWLIVLGDNANIGQPSSTIKQIWMRQGSESNHFQTYVRTSNDGTNWNNWVRFITEKEVYSDLKVAILSIPNVTVPAGSYVNVNDTSLASLTDTNKSPIGVIGYTLASDYAQYLVMYKSQVVKNSNNEYFYEYSIHNNYSSAITLELRVKILYVENHSVKWSSI